MKQKFKFEPQWFAVVLFFAAGVFLGIFSLFVWLYNGGAFYGIAKIHLAHSNYKYINPLLAVDTDTSRPFFEDAALKGKFQTIIDAQKKAKNISEASMYFRDLEPGRWAGLNEDTLFTPGKILKVVLMIAYYKNAEADPAVLKKTFVFKKQPGDTQTDIQLEGGKTYTTEDLIQDMIVNDGDSSTLMLYDNINNDSLNEVYSDLGLNFKENKTDDDFITIKQYGLFFRILYNATYLNRAYSEEALKLLDETPTDIGIAAGLPNDWQVPHKYRVREKPEANGFKEVHDCGIVYYPRHPYLLCAMAKARTTDIANDLLKQFGDTAYQTMDAQYNKTKNY